MEKEPEKSAVESTVATGQKRPIGNPKPAPSPCEAPNRIRASSARSAKRRAVSRSVRNQGYLKIATSRCSGCSVAGSVFRKPRSGDGVPTPSCTAATKAAPASCKGPFSPIYGVGAVVLTVSLNRFYHSHNLMHLPHSYAAGLGDGYATSWLMECCGAPSPGTIPARSAASTAARTSRSA